MRLDPELPVWSSKQRVLVTLSQSLSDVLNYAGVQRPSRKVLDEERLLKEYPLPPITPIPYLEFRYKRRVYTQSYVDDKQLAKLHTKANLKRFMEHVHQKNVEKVSKWLEKGLDPNFHDSDTGGEEPSVPDAGRAAEESGDLIKACRYGNVQHLEHLLFYGADMSSQNASGNTALHLCALYNSCARVLLFRGANKDIKNYNNQTAFQ
ncbi:hypothetical protein F7725_022110, partial [Dissostichus mawsoni]